MTRICLIEDDPIMGESLSDRFLLEGFALDWFKRGGPALEALRGHRYDAVISDVRLPDVSGEDIFTSATREVEHLPPFLFITAYASVDRAVDMLKRGAHDYVTKPFDISELVTKVQRAVGAPAIVGDATSNDESPLGPSVAMRALASQAPRVAERARTVLITGESGAGKEVLARHLHALAHPEGEAPFVAVNCGAIPSNLIEAALFGHERGAFTGADRMRKGHFEQAHTGTLFLDEIAELTPAMQVNLLRVLQDRRVQRVGGEDWISVDLRLICATHQDLRKMVEQGSFREDLYNRINVVHLAVPPLRARPDDVLWLAQALLAEQAAQLGEQPRALGPGARAALLAHSWPGNVRELRNRIERACILSSNAVLTAADLFETAEPTRDDLAGLPTLAEFVSDAERSYLQAILQRFDGKVGSAAAALGISRKTLWEKSKRYGLRTDEPPLG
ncbi:MAG TPA: sigma-54 dependent transcriptional regulator [Burkholderiaceae bacterium]|nr:sigma-54 dependent transcriptional regulator [Burkholderiaceae bacterium]HQR72142.1 sigma-54 dependent transcriptional regulator [Burkholderiaceae bacterium]